MKRETREKLKEAFTAAAREEADRMEREVADIPLPGEFPALTLPSVPGSRRRVSLRRALIAAAAAVLLLVFFVVPVSAGGKTAASFLLEVLEKHTFFYAKPNGQNAPDRIETFYTVDPPEGYTVTKKELFVLEDIFLSLGLTWAKGTNTISFSQSLIGGSDTMDSENAHHEEVDWNGYSVYYYYKWGQSYALWLTEEYKFFLIADNTDKEAFFAIMDTLRELTPEELETFERT